MHVGSKDHWVAGAARGTKTIATPLPSAGGRYDYFCAGRAQDVPDDAHRAAGGPEDILHHITRFVANDVSDVDPSDDTRLTNRRSGAMDLDSVYARAVRLPDGRIDDSAVCAIGTAFARFHNLCVGAAPPGGSDARFVFAQQQTRWLHQWLAVNDLAAQLCDPGVLNDVMQEGAPVYSAFLARMGSGGYGGKLPVPIEATLMLTHAAAVTDDTVTSLFEVTGDARFAADAATPDLWLSDRGPVFNMDHSFDARRSHNVHVSNTVGTALPDAAECRAMLQAHDIRLPHCDATGFREDLPGYLEDEAEAWSEGLTFGPLGSRLLAEALVGIAWNTPGTYRLAPGCVSGQWHPRDGLRPSGMVVDSYETLAQVTDLI